MKGAENGKRYGKRVPTHYTIRVKHPLTSKWDVCMIRNISKTGVMFYSSNSYEPGSEVEIKIMNPILHGEISCSAKVARCFPLADMESMYGVALGFLKMEQSDKEALEKTIELFLQKKKKEENA